MHKCHYIVLYFYEIIKHVTTVRMLILKRERRNYLKTNFYDTHIRNANNG